MDQQSQTPPTDRKTELAGERTSLAKLRVELALERTTLAWIRTTLSMVSFGFGIVGFFRTLKSQARTPEAELLHQHATWFGYGLLATGIVATFLCAVVHYRSVTALAQGTIPSAGKWSLALGLALLLAVAGLVALYRLIAAG